ERLACGAREIAIDGQRLGGLGGRESVRRAVERFFPTSKAPPPDRPDLVRGDGDRPGDAVAGRIEAGRLLEQLDQGLLRRVLREALVAQRARGEPPEERPERVERRLDRRAIPGGQALEKLLDRPARGRRQGIARSSRASVGASTSPRRLDDARTAPR